VAWLFTQVWVLCLVSFLLGALVTWLAFVRPAQRTARDTPDRPAAPTPPAWALPGHPQVPEPRAEDQPPRPPEPTVPPVDPALAALNGQSTDARGRPAPAVGTAAAGALDLLGVHPEPPQPPPPTPPTAKPPTDGPQERTS
jgi:hypothetical protein